MPKIKVRLLLLMFALIITGCNPSKGDVLETLVSKKAGHFSMQIFANSDFSTEVNKVHNSEPILLKYIDDVTIHTEKEKLQWLKALGLEEERPIILIFDTEKVVFQTSDPEKLRGFAKNQNVK